MVRLGLGNRSFVLSMRKFEDEIREDTRYLYLQSVAHDLYQLHEESPSAESRLILYDALYDASFDEWVARVYTYLIMSSREDLKSIWQRAFGLQVSSPRAATGALRISVPIHPPTHAMEKHRSNLISVLKHAGNLK